MQTYSLVQINPFQRVFRYIHPRYRAGVVGCHIVPASAQLVVLQVEVVSDYTVRRADRTVKHDLAVVVEEQLSLGGVVSWSSVYFAARRVDEWIAVSRAELNRGVDGVVDVVFCQLT